MSQLSTIGTDADSVGRQADGRRQALDGVGAVVDGLAADHLAARQGDQHGPSCPASDLIPPGAEPSVVAQLLRTTTGVLRSMHLEVASGPGADPQVYGLARRIVAQGRELRSVYPSSVLDQPAALDWMATWAAVGENQRLGDAVPHEFVVFGAEAVVALPHWGRTGGGAVVSRQPVVVQAFTRVFDAAWSRAVVLPGAAGGSQSAAQLLNLLAAGCKDEAIARALGVGVRTVRRRIAETMAELGVHTRFQLGAAAERRALLAAAPD